MEILLKTFEYLGGAAAALGVVKWLYKRDAVAAEKCSETICKFRSMIENLGSHLRNPNRHPDRDLPRLLELKPLLKELRLKRRGLLFKPRFLDSGIRKNLKLFSRLNNLNRADQHVMIAAELITGWGIPTTAPYEAAKLIEIQAVLEKPSFLRWALGIVSWIRPLK